MQPYHTLRQDWQLPESLCVGCAFPSPLGIVFPLYVENHLIANIPGAESNGLLYLKQRSVGPYGRRGKLLPLEICGSYSRVRKKLGDCWEVQSQFCKEWVKFPIAGSELCFPGHSGDCGSGWEGTPGLCTRVQDRPVLFNMSPFLRIGLIISSFVFPRNSAL